MKTRRLQGQLASAVRSFVFLAEGDERRLGDLFLLTENNTAAGIWIKKGVGMEYKTGGGRGGSGRTGGGGCGDSSIV